MASSQVFASASAEELIATLATAITAYPVTLMAWFTRDSSNGQMISVGTAFASKRMCLELRDASKLGANFNQTSGGYAFAGSTALSDNVWYHGALVVRSATDQEIYLNGVSEATSSHDIGAAVSNEKAAIGVLFPNGTPTMNGNVCCAKVFTRELTVPEINEEMNRYEPATDSCVFCPNLLVDASAASDYKDLSIAGNDVDEATLPSSSGSGPPIFKLPGQ